MRYGVVSDVHGNIEALEVVLAHLATQNVDKMVFLGDAVGYGANPNEVCDRLRGVVDYAVIGNHDAAVVGHTQTEAYYPAAQHALAWCKERLSGTNAAWLAALPYKLRIDDLEFCHGSPVAPEMFDYLFGVEQVTALLPYIDELARVTLIGHSHLTLSFAIGEDEIVPMVAPQIQCRPGYRYIMTVGSVGQPRDRDPRTCCVVYDTDTATLDYHRLDYDIATTRQKILDAGLARVFAERLLVGM